MVRLDLQFLRSTYATGRAVRVLSFHALQEPGSWTWLPRVIVVEGRAPDSGWRRLETLTHDVDEHASPAHRFEVDPAGAGPLTGVRPRIDALETCPGWHLGRGRPPWVFLDELRIE